MLRHIHTAFDGTLALNGWAGREGRIAIDDPAELLDTPIELTVPAVGRYA